MPDAWDIIKGQVVESNPGDDDNIVIAVNRYPQNDEQNESDVYKYIHFTLPKPWGMEITRGDVLDADADPVLTPTDIENVENINKYLLTFLYGTTIILVICHYSSVGRATDS